MKKLLSGGGKKDTKDKNKDKNFKEYIWPDGGKYEGEWKDGKMHGNGKFIEVNGTWMLMHGALCSGVKERCKGMERRCSRKGIDTRACTITDCGMAREYRPLPTGTSRGLVAVVVSLTSSRYEGDFWQGQIHGQGIYTCADGRRYAGEFKNNQKHG
eukprot:756862-Hanusia_phi.AAC.1